MKEVFGIALGALLLQIVAIGIDTNRIHHDLQRIAVALEKNP